VPHKCSRITLLSDHSRKPAAKAPGGERMRTILKRNFRNLRFSCPRIVSIISQTFGVDIDATVVFGMLSRHQPSLPRETVPSWVSSWGIQWTACGASICFAASLSSSTAEWCSLSRVCSLAP
jgi:hypothetical protein